MIGLSSDPWRRMKPNLAPGLAFGFAPRARRGGALVLAGAVLSFLVGACEAMPRIMTTVSLPAGLAVSREQLHLEAASRPRPPFVPEYEARHLGSFERTAHGATIVFSTGIGNETYTYARVWVDVDRSGTLSRGDLTGELAPAPFRAIDRGMFSCSSNVNRAPNIVTSTVATISPSAPRPE